MSKKHLRLDPQKPTKIDGKSESWWYEGNGGIEVVVRTPTHIGWSTSTVFISWRKLRSALARKDK